MQKWEYLSIVADVGDQAVWRVRRIGDKELPDWWLGRLLSDYMTELGDQGWELVHVSWAGPTVDTFVGRLFFKRPMLDTSHAWAFGQLAAQP